MGRAEKKDKGKKKPKTFQTKTLVMFIGYLCNWGKIKSEHLYITYLCM